MTYQSTTDYNVETAGDFVTLHLAVLADMDAGDTATVTVRVPGGAGDTADIVGGGSPHNTFFSGHMVA